MAIHSDPEYSVAVVIPTFNRARVLPRALASVQSQTQPATEIIVVDDGSTDDTESVIRHQFPKVRYLYQPNRGVSAARNLGIRATKCRWIALLDSDDLWGAQKLAAQIWALRRQPQFQIAHCDEIWIRNGRRINPKQKHRKFGGHIFRQCLELCAISPSSVVIHKDVFRQTGDFDEALPACEDYDMWLRICAFYDVLFIAQALVTKYGGHTDQLSRQHWGMDRFRVSALIKILGDTRLQNGDRDAARAMLRRKLEILVQGARNRQNRVAVRQYESLTARYCR